MAESWTDDRIDATLRALADELDVPGPDGLAPVHRPVPQRRTWWLAAAAVVLVIAAVVIVPPARASVARWFGVRVERDDGASGTGAFADDVTDLDVDAAIEIAGLDRATLERTTLGRPAAAGTPPEGGVLLSWRDGATTLWVRPGDDDVVVVKRLIGSTRADVVSDLGDYAVLIEGDHVLDTPARRVAAGTVLWWLADGRQWRLESDLDAATMLDIATALTAS